MPHTIQSIIYRSRWQLAFTFSLIIIPLIYALWFSAYATVREPTFWLAVGVSAIRLFVAYVISVIAAWILAVLFSRGRVASIALPLFDVLQSFPTFAALPLAVIVWGSTNTIIVVFLILTIIWPLLFSIISALKRTNQEWHEVVEIAGLSRWQRFKKFLWPVSVPGIITGSIIGLGEGWEALIATELIVNSHTGLGAFFQQVTDKPEVVAFGILGLLLVIFSINKLIWLPLLDTSHQKLETE